MELLRAEHIEKNYANHKALNDVSILVKKQSVFGLLGPNGAGKTTLIRIINQITGPDKGELFFNGEKLQAKHISLIGYLPEERGLYKKMKVGEQALYLAQLKGMKKNEAKEKLKIWFKKFDIYNWWDKKVEELSKGMAQKIQFITTVLHEPSLLILDEPFSGFDPINANLLKEEILKLRDEGATVIFSTHNMESVEAICDNICLINQSKKILDGSVQEIRNSYKKNIFEVKFKGNLIAFTNALWTGYELLNTTQENDFILAQVKALNASNPNELLKSIIPEVEVYGLQELLPSMNEIFITKVNEQNQVKHG